MILTALAWLAALVLAAMAAWRLSRIVLIPKRAHTGKRMRGDSLIAPNWYALALWSAFAVAAFTLLGVFAPLTGWMAAGTALAVALAGFRVWTPDGWSALREHLMSAPGDAWGDLLRALRQHGDAEPAGETQEVVTEAVTTRGIPSVMDDPALGPAPEPGELASPAIPVPAPWAALAEYIRSREPEDDMELRMLAEGDAAGALAVADARHAFADTCLNMIGLDPAYVAGILETGDSMAEHASMLAQVHKRFGVIYGAIKEWVAAHGPLPHKARDFLTGE